VGPVEDAGLRASGRRGRAWRPARSRALRGAPLVARGEAGPGRCFRPPVN